MAIDSIGGTTSAPTTQRATATAVANTVRANAPVLNAIVTKQQRSSNASAVVKAFAVPQTSKGGESSKVKVPRGSFVDVLA